MNGIETSWLLLVGGLLLIALEVMAPGVYLLWFGLAALLAGALDAALGLSWQASLAAFCAFSIVTVGLGRWMTRAGSEHDEGERVVLNSRAGALLGREVPLYEAIVGGRGAVRIDDTIWRVRGPDAPAGAMVRLARVEGVGFAVDLVQGG